MSFNIGDKIKLNPELVTDQSILANPTAQFGSLGYFVAFLDLEYEVVKLFNDQYQGEMMEVKILNAENVKANVAFKVQDCILAGPSMYKLDYEILGQANPNEAKIIELKTLEQQLLDERTMLKASGKAITDTELKSNWKKILSTRNEIKKLATDTTKLVNRVKVNTKVPFIMNYEGKPEDLERKILSEIRSRRKASRVLTKVEKVIAGNTKYSMIGNIMAEAGTIARLNENFAKNIIKENKKPVTKEDNYVGIEVEMLSPKTIEQMQLEFIKARLHRYVSIGTDGSISTDTEKVHPMELRILLPERNLATHLKAITEVLRRNDCYTNRSCGLHVHLDMRNRDAETQYSKLFKLQELMFATQPSTRRNNTYCKKNKKDNLKKSEFESNDRYSAINTQAFNEHTTLEIRLHEGASKFKDIYNWAKFLVDVCNFKGEISKSVSTIQELKALNITEENVINHLNERIEEYAS